MTAPRTLAEYYRAKRIAFTLALELGVTPAEAEGVIADREARLRWLAAEQRRHRDPATARSAAPQPAESAEPWMMRE